MPNLLDFSYSEIIYAWLVMLMSDWHHGTFCEELLVKHYDRVQRKEISCFYKWENESVKRACYLTIEEVKVLQEKFSNLDTDDRWYFCQFLKTFE